MSKTRKQEVKELAQDLDLLVITANVTVRECEEMGGVSWTTAKDEKGKTLTNESGQNLGNCLHKPT